jgi:hypothetical protein
VLPSDTWALGEPDVIIEVPEEQVPATGVIDFLIKRSTLNLPEDKWVRAVAYDVGAKSVLHSLLLYALDRDADIRSPEDMIHPDNASFFSIYVPGEATESFREDSGFLLPAGSDLSFKIRYTSSGRAAVDNTRIGLYFHDEPPAMALQTVRMRNDELLIPPEVRDHREFSESPPLTEDSHFESFSPHAHVRGMAVRLIARYLDGERELFSNVANYNFNWQLAYNLAERKTLPAGTVLEAETVYDNSPSNLFIADFDREVRWGVSDQDEMFSHFVRLAVPRVTP